MSRGARVFLGGIALLLGALMLMIAPEDGNRWGHYAIGAFFLCIGLACCATGRAGAVFGSIVACGVIAVGIAYVGSALAGAVQADGRGASALGDALLFLAVFCVPAGFYVWTVRFGMRRDGAAASNVFGRMLGLPQPPAPAALGDRQVVPLDAQALAEQGIADAYRTLLPRLQDFVGSPVAVEDGVDEARASYRVQAGTREYLIYAPDVAGTDAQRWGRATHALFAIVNEQLAGTDVRLYALYGGNDLGGIFLSEAEAAAACAALEHAKDRPYLPTPEPPHYGYPY